MAHLFVFSPYNPRYEARSEDGAEPPSVLVVDDDGLAKYRTKVREYPIVDGPLLSNTTVNLGELGRYTIPTVTDENVHPWNLTKIADSSQEWSEDSLTVKIHTLQCLNSTDIGPARQRHTIEPGRYYVIFDWTDDVLQSPTEEQVTAQVSLRATKPIEEEVETTATTSLAQLYGRMTDSRRAVADSGTPLMGRRRASTHQSRPSKVPRLSPVQSALVSSVLDREHMQQTLI